MQSAYSFASYLFEMNNDPVLLLFVCVGVGFGVLVGIVGGVSSLLGFFIG